jgi:dipeptidyl aminopeptidase/acylaminoacyl peptidase
MRAIALWLLLASAARADLPPLIPREVIFGNPPRTSPRLSPDGKRVAWLAPDSKNVLQVWVRGQTGDAKQITREKRRGIRNYRWAHDGRTLLYLQDNDGDENFHVYGADLESANVRDYTPFAGVRADVIDLRADAPDQVLVTLNVRDRQVFDVWRLTLSTGALVPDTQNPGDVDEWATDVKLQVRAAHATLEDGSIEVRYRDAPGQPWRVLQKAAPSDTLDVLTISGEGRVLLISDVGRATAAVVARDPAGGAEQVLAQSRESDALATSRVAPLFHPRSNGVQAVPFAPGRRQWVAVDTSVEGDFKALAKVFDGDFDVVSRDDADAHWVVRYASDKGDRWYVWDRAQKKALLLFEQQPALSRYRLAEMKPISFAARDGLGLHGYLTLPPGVREKGLPMVLLVHGGPWSRDEWGWVPTAQWLANRGYAVLQINYRGSIGYGKTLLNAGNKQWGLKMHTDLLDAMDWAVKRGYADAKKVAVYGGSYGGYAALASVTFTPEVFACAVDMVGPSNLRTLLQSIPPYWKVARRTFNLRMGNPDDPADAQLIENASPLFKADRIVRPLLIGQGQNDPRVNVRESEQIVSAIAKHGGKVTYVLYSDEGHGFARPENRADFNARAEIFLAKCLGGRAESMRGERYPGSTAVVRVVGN